MQWKSAEEIISESSYRPPFTFNQLRSFVVAAEEGSITLAAERLRIAQSAISIAIANLEEQLSIQLLVRDHAKGVRLTESGGSFLVRAREALTAIKELGEFGRELGSEIAGELRLGCYSYIAPFVLPSLLKAFGAPQHFPLSADFRKNFAAVDSLARFRTKVSSLRVAIRPCSAAAL